MSPAATAAMDQIGAALRAVAEGRIRELA